MKIISNKVTIIINCYNGDNYLKEAIDSIYNQSYKNWEIIFFDNNSKDKSAEVAQSYDKKLKYHKSDKTLDLGIARKLAFSLGDGEFLALCDSDDFWHPEKLKKQVYLLNKNKSEFIFSDSFYIDKSSQIIKGYIKRNMIDLNDIKIKEFLLRSGAFFHMGSILMKRSLYNKSGGFDKKFDINHDTDLWFRLNELTDFNFINQKLTYYRMHDNNITKNKMLTHSKNIINLTIREINKPNNSIVGIQYGNLRMLDSYYFLLLNDEKNILSRLTNFIYGLKNIEIVNFFSWLYQKIKKQR